MSASREHIPQSFVTLRAIMRNAPSFICARFAREFSPPASRTNCRAAPSFACSMYRQSSSYGAHCVRFFNFRYRARLRWRRSGSSRPIASRNEGRVRRQQIKRRGPPAPCAQVRGWGDLRRTRMPCSGILFDRFPIAVRFTRGYDLIFGRINVYANPSTRVGEIWPTRSLSQISKRFFA